ncbi:MAG: hypothetical protein V3R96_06625 [Dehalococcoidales bacterium]
MADKETDSTSVAWRKTARSRLRFELGGLAFARQHGFSSEDYARHFWDRNPSSWMGKEKPEPAEYLRKEAKAFTELYPGVSFKVLETDDDRAELVFTRGCLAGWGKDPWALARSLGLTDEDVCAYCRESFNVWAQHLGLRTSIGPEKDGNCHLRVSGA